MSRRRSLSTAVRALGAVSLSLLIACDDGLVTDAPDPNLGTATEALSNADLAFHWAPVNYQDVNKKSGTGLGGLSDYLLPFDYDGDFNMRNNWDNVRNGPASVGYTIIETASHFMIGYQMYHPRDWSAGTGQEHENDAESAIILVRKDTTTFGTLEAVLTMFHDGWQSYRAQPYVSRGPCNPDTPALIEIENGRPRTFQEAEGHGLLGCTSGSNCVRGDDGIRYVASTIAGGLQPSPIPDGQQVTVVYTVADMKPLLDRRWDHPVFFNPSTMAGDSSSSCGDGLSTCLDDAAVGFWAHIDGRIPNTPACGALRTAPGEDMAAFMNGYFAFAGKPPVSTTYVTNTVLHQKCDVGRRLEGSSDACVQQICATDPFCCSTTWDSLCASEVTSVCGKSCSNCYQDPCHTHTTPVGAGCDSLCAQKICAVDPFCCTNSWDGQCVSEMTSICGLSCAP